MKMKAVVQGLFPHFSKGTDRSCKGQCRPRIRGKQGKCSDQLRSWGEEATGRRAIWYLEGAGAAHRAARLHLCTKGPKCERDAQAPDF